MVKLTTDVHVTPSKWKISLSDRILVLGSCFADGIGTRLSLSGFDVCVNPFGTIYNPASIESSLRLLCGDALLGPDDCVQMGAGSDKICSWHHYTKCARSTQEQFLHDANSSLDHARKFWKTVTKVIITFGTSWVWEHGRDGIVANCLKRDAREFTHRMLSFDECSAYIRNIVDMCKGKEVIFTVSPIRHMAQGAHQNTLSKAMLHLCLDSVTSGLSPQFVSYFPAYEILTDQLRDYRFYAADLVHPSETAVQIIWEQFVSSYIAPQDMERLEANEKQSKRNNHIQNKS